MEKGRIDRFPRETGKGGARSERNDEGIQARQGSCSHGNTTSAEAGCTENDQSDLIKTNTG